MVCPRILIVEDDAVLALVLKDFFEENDYEVIHVISGEEAVRAYKREHFSVVLLDVMLPGISGFEVMKKIREVNNSIPVIMMTGTEYGTDNQVKGYDLGAVNYVQKPIVPQVLLAQVKRLLNPPEMEKYNPGGYHITICNQEVRINNDTYTLHDREARVLSVLLRKQNEIVSRKDLLCSVWKNDHPSLNNYLDSSISKIRKVLDCYPGIKIKRVYGKGYGIMVGD
ncbi:MAG: response regulator transcription factor [Prevotellaceae bacterium]|jgi:DNA-binding response OmpR family regulator|nr:response regulator transcription factor [Prevotellaceae bacterium]